MSIMRTGKDRQGFTIIELLVVIAAIAILLGLLLVGLQSASRMSQNVRSLSRLKQVHIAWTTYSNAYDDRLLPGYISPAVQDNWRVRYKSADGERLGAGACATYPWRLLPYLDFDLDPMYGYSGNFQELKNNYANPDAGGYNTAIGQIAEIPAFGYNAYYLGGWWEERDNRSHMIYGNSTAEIQIGDTVRNVKGRLVATSISQIVQPDMQIAFCSSVYRNQGQYVVQDDNPPGAAWVVPPRLCTQQIWRVFSGDVQATLTPASLVPVQSAGDGMDVLVSQAVPLRRHGITVPILNCDGSSKQATLEDLLDMNRWTGAAVDAPGNPRTFEHECDEGP